ncbi:MAG: PAS-domain containing protein [Proteobacteria bacterium]|nr:PAS-domain containing protein [Pseudomonadota bacterium]
MAAEGPLMDGTLMLPRARTGGGVSIRPRLLRYAGLVVALSAFLIGVFFSFQGLFEQRELIEKESRINIWFLAQVDIEYLQMMESLKEFALAPVKDPQATEERFEIFWSRLPVMLKGPQTAGLREVEGFVEAVSAMIRTLEEVEPDMGQLASITPARLAEIDRKLDILRKPVHDMVRRALLYETDEVGQTRARHNSLYTKLVALFAATLVGGVTIFMLLFNQILKTHRAVVAADTAAEAARAARTELELAINSISEGFIIYDQRDRVALFNQKYVELHPGQADIIAVGVSFEALLRHAIARGGIAVEPENVEDWVRSTVAQHLAPGDTFESRLDRGTWLKISERRTSDGRVVGVHTDITELKERETLINQKSTLLQTTLENMKQGIAVFDRDQRLLIFNDRFIEINNYPEGFVHPARSYAELVRFNVERENPGAGDVEARVFSQLDTVRRLLQEKSGSLRQERRLPDGRVVETIHAALPTGGFVKTYMDITERVRSEADRTRLTEQFHAAQKMQALGTLAGGIAHDFNNIIGSVLGNVSLMMIDTPKDDPAYRRLQQIVEAGTRARALVRQILTYSRYAELDRKPVDISRAISASLEVIRPLLPRNVSLQTGRWASCAVSGDATQLHQIVLNLCLNAAQAIGDARGRITVSVEPVDIKNSETDVAAPLDLARPRSMPPVQARAGTIGPGRYVRILVSDTGSGIDAATMPRIFEPFFTTKEVGKGTGLGLAAVHGIVRNHEGAITVESVPGIGTCFAIFLPLVDGPPPAIEREPLGQASGGHERILLIDDDRKLLSVTQEVLTRLGYTVESSAEPARALELFRERPTAWDLVISDLAMPRMPGEVLSAEMLKVRPDLPIIMLSGFISDKDDAFLRALGVRAIVTKPVLPDEIDMAIRSVLAGTV